MTNKIIEIRRELAKKASKSIMSLQLFELFDDNIDSPGFRKTGAEYASKALMDLHMFERALHIYENEEWLITGVVARLSGLNKKTISNMASSGRFTNSRFEDGRWLIHRSEMEQLHEN